MLYLTEAQFHYCLLQYRFLQNKNLKYQYFSILNTTLIFKRLTFLFFLNTLTPTAAAPTRAPKGPATIAPIGIMAASINVSATSLTPEGGADKYVRLNFNRCKTYDIYIEVLHALK